jgi:hypothetical protein
MQVNKNSELVNYIVINDFRSHPVNAAIAIYQSLKRKNIDVKIIVAEKYLNYHDYGSKLPYFYKLVKYLWLRLWYQVVCISDKKSTILTTIEEKGILSSLHSITLDSSASEDKYPSLYNILHGAAIGAKQIFESLQHANNIEKIYLFNGRTAGTYPIARGCFDYKIKIEFYEYADRNGGFKLFPCAPHDTAKLGKAVVEYRKVCLLTSQKLFQRANEWRLKRLTNPYTKFYQIKYENSFDVVVFLGSDHEYTCLDEDISGYRYIGNYELVKQVLAKYGTSARIAVRAHPNQAADKNHKHILKNIENLCEVNGITFFGPNSNVSSYDLIKNSSVTAVEFSSIAYDAILLGRKVELFNDLDLKYFLQSLSIDQLNDKSYVSNYICELMCLYDELYFERFNMWQGFSSWFWSRFEWKLLQVSKFKTHS